MESIYRIGEEYEGVYGCWEVYKLNLILGRAQNELTEDNHMVYHITECFLRM